MTTDTIIEDIIKALHSSTVLDPFSKFEPSYEFSLPMDPVARLTAEPGVEKPILQPLGERDSQVDILTSTPEERRQARKTYRQSTPGSSASFQAAQAATMPEPKNWFKRYGGGPNGDLSGFIPLKALAPIEGKRHFMKPSAAVAYKAMQRAAKKDGINFSITDSYRDYQAQVRLKAAKPSLAATPGHSNHGWGLALDINVNDPRVYNWLAKNGKRFGFEQPMSYEPWHWEYKGGFKGVAKVSQAKAPRQRKPKPEPIEHEVTVSSLISAPTVFGSVVSEIQNPPATRREFEQQRKAQGLGFVPAKYRDLFRQAADRYGLPAKLLAMVAKHESNFDPRAVSSAGAQGLMQIMPLHGLKNPFSPKENVFAGARILAGYIEQAGSVRGGLAFYNGGPGNPQWDYADMILDALRNRRAA